MRLFLLLFCLLLPSSSSALTDASGGGGGASATFSFRHLICLLLVGGTFAEEPATTTGESATILPPKPPKTYPCHQLPPDPTIADIIHCDNTYALQIKPPGGVIDLSKATQPQVDHLRPRTLSSSFRLVSSSINKVHFRIAVAANTYTAEIRNNDHLVDLTIDNSHPKGGRLELTVRGNRRLSQKSIDDLKLVTDVAVKYVQNFGECIVGNLKSFNELEDCQYIYGDLNIGPSLTDASNFPSNLTKITGCVKIIDSNLDNVDFLFNLNTRCSNSNEISNNAKLCLNSEKIASIQNKMNSKISQPDTCKDICSWNWAQQEKEKVKCHTIEGDVVIFHMNDENDLAYLDSVVEIIGHLTFMRNNFTKYTIFKNLRKVDISHNTRSTRAAILFYDNRNLEFFNFSSLQQLILPPGSKAPKLAIDKNKEGFKFTEEEYNELKKKFGHIRVPVNITSTPGGNGTGDGTGSSRTSDAGDEEDAYVGAGTVIAIVLPTFVFLLLVAIGIVLLVVFLRLRNKRRKKENEKAEYDPWNGIYHGQQIEDDVTVYKPSVYTGAMQKAHALMNQNLDLRELTEDEVKYFTHCREALFAGPHKANLAITSLPRFKKRKLTLLADNLDFGKAKNLNKEHMSYGCDSSLWTCEINYQCYYYNPIKFWKAESPSVETCNNIDDYIRACFASDDVKYGSSKSPVMQTVLEYIKGHDYSGGNHSLIEVTGPCHIVGELRGCTSDLLAILSMDPVGSAARKEVHPALYYKFIFTGNYFNGFNDAHTMLFLLVLAKRCPDNIILLRGLNEYKFKSEFLRRRFDAEMDELAVGHFMPALETLPVAALVNDKVLVVSGGISDSMIAGKDMMKADFIKQLPKLYKGVPKLIHDVVGSSPNYVSHPQNENAIGSYFNSSTVRSMRTLYNWKLLVTGSAPCASVLMGRKLICVRGIFDDRMRSIGLSSLVFDDRGEMIRDLPSVPSSGTLRIEGDGTLTMLMLRHQYEQDDVSEMRERIVAARKKLLNLP